MGDLDLALVLALVAVVAAAFATGLFLVNLLVFRPPPSPGRDDKPPAVSVLIPARNEERVIGAAVRSVLAGAAAMRFEVLVLDDGSEDATADVVREIALDDPRVRLETAPPLPAGWCGKQHACAVLAERARHPVLVFMDADVRLAPDALPRIVAALGTGRAALVSGFPRQETGTWAERLLIPLIHFVLLAYLPLPLMRRSTRPAYGAACGQLIAVRRDVYEQVGGHGGIRTSLHDGLHLPRLFRRHGHLTDLFDATDVAVCRMYEGTRNVFAGLGKNAHQGMGAPGTILPMTLLLLAGQVLPFALLAAGLTGAISGGALVLTGVAVGLAWLPRWVAVPRFHQPVFGALAHPLGVLALLGSQWWALLRHLLGRPASWKGRSYEAATSAAMASHDLHTPSRQPPAP